MSTRVAVVTTVLPDYKVHLYERLARRPGWELQLWHGPGRAAEALPDADPGDRIAHHSARNLHLTLGLPLVWQRVWRSLWSFRPDVVVLDEFVRVLSSWPLLVEARRRAVGTVLYGHGENRERLRTRGRLLGEGIEWARGRMHALADALVVYTEPSARRYRAAHPERACFVAGNTLDTDAIARVLATLPPDHVQKVRARLGVPDGALLLVTVGRLIEQHDPRPILPSLVRARQLGAPLHLLVVGSGPLEGEAHDAATRLPGDHRHAVHLLPRQPLDETTRLLAACDAFVCPGTIGLNIVHAFAVGLPFVASSSFEHGPEEDYLLDGENGLRIDDVGGALVGALLRLWQEPALRRRLGEAALAFARAHLSPAEQARGFVEAIEYVLARRAGRQVAPPPREAPRLRTRLRA